MTKGRLEAFSDGVLAIVITIMVLELKVPHGDDWRALTPLIPPFLSYLLSFVFLGIYWNNHHHLLHIASGINGKILWANLHLLFWLSLIPFVTGWMGESRFAAFPTAAYGVVMLFAAIAYTLLERTIIEHQGRESKLREALGHDLKGKSSLLLYLLAIPSSFLNRWIACGIYVLVAAMWLLPDRRIEARLRHT